MNRHSHQLLQWLVVSVSVGMVIWWLMPRQPRYEGKPAGQWVRQLNSPLESESDAAKKAIRELGTNAAPLLIEKLQATESALTSNLTQLAQKQTLLKLDLTTASEERSQGIQGFLALGTNANSSIPDLMKLLDNPTSADSAAYILTELNNKAIPWLIQAATHTNPIVRHRVVLDLGYRHTNAPGVVPVLIHTLQDPDSKVRGAATYALSRFLEEGKTIVPALLPLLDDSDLKVRLHAAQSLGTFGEQAKAAVPALLRVVKRDGPSSTAGGALRKIDPGAALKAGVEPEDFSPKLD